MSIFSFTIFFLLSRFTFAQNLQMCKSRQCNFVCSPGNSDCIQATFICTGDVIICNLKCEDSGCKDGVQLYSSASYTSVDCDAKDACEGIHVNCGDWTSQEPQITSIGGTYKSCNIKCGEVGCKKAVVNCAGDFKTGTGCLVNAALPTSAVDGFLEGTMICKMANDQSKCNLRCGSVKACTQSAMRCEKFGRCKCTGKLHPNDPIGDPQCPEVYQNTPKPTVRIIKPIRLTKKPITKKPTTNPTPKPSRTPTQKPSKLTVYDPLPKFARVLKSGSCRFDCSKEDCSGHTLICETGCHTCELECGSGNCDKVTAFYSAAKRTNVRCDEPYACSRSKFVCGNTQKYPNLWRRGKYTHCSISCGGHYSCHKAVVRCNGKFALGCDIDATAVAKQKTQQSNFAGSALFCANTNFCRLNCGANPSACAGATCMACTCEGANCPVVDMYRKEPPQQPPRTLPQLVFTTGKPTKVSLTRRSLTTTTGGTQKTTITRNNTTVKHTTTAKVINTTLTMKKTTTAQIIRTIRGLTTTKAKTQEPTQRAKTVVVGAPKVPKPTTTGVHKV